MEFYYIIFNSIYNIMCKDTMDNYFRDDSRHGKAFEWTQGKFAGKIDGFTEPEGVFKGNFPLESLKRLILLGLRRSGELLGKA